MAEQLLPTIIEVLIPGLLDEEGIVTCGNCSGSGCESCPQPAMTAGQLAELEEHDDHWCCCGGTGIDSIWLAHRLLDLEDIGPASPLNRLRRAVTDAMPTLVRGSLADRHAVLLDEAFTYLVEGHETDGSCLDQDCCGFPTCLGCGESWPCVTVDIDWSRRTDNNDEQHTALAKGGCDVCLSII